MTFSVPHVLEDCSLLQSDVVISHATGSTNKELKLLKDNGVYISCTPGTES
jgi:cytosine/adenosine deaminase-related metal-dependent hydrolase